MKLTLLEKKRTKLPSHQGIPCFFLLGHLPTQEEWRLLPESVLTDFVRWLDGLTPESVWSVIGFRTLLSNFWTAGDPPETSPMLSQCSAICGSKHELSPYGWMVKLQYSFFFVFEIRTVVQLSHEHILHSPCWSHSLALRFDSEAYGQVIFCRYWRWWPNYHTQWVYCILVGPFWVDSGWMLRCLIGLAEIRVAVAARLRGSINTGQFRSNDEWCAKFAPKRGEISLYCLWNAIRSIDPTRGSSWILGRHFIVFLALLAFLGQEMDRVGVRS